MSHHLQYERVFRAQDLGPSYPVTGVPGKRLDGSSTLCWT